MGELPRLPQAIFERAGVGGHQHASPDHLAYCDLATDRQRCPYDVIRHHDALTVSSMQHRNSTLPDALRQVLKCVVAGWAWAHDTDTIVHQDVKAGMDAKILKARLLFNWTGP